jgi:hypothetical protein
LEIDELRTVEATDAAGKPYQVVVSRQAESRIVDPNTKIALTTQNINYGSKLFFPNGSAVKKGDKIGEIINKDEFSDYGDYILNFQYWQKTEPIDVFDQLKCFKK